MKGVFSKPSGIWKPYCCTKSLFFELETSNFGYLLILLNCAKFQQDWTTLITPPRTPRISRLKIKKQNVEYQCCSILLKLSTAQKNEKNKQAAKI